jgi:hypothetical protein
MRAWRALALGSLEGDKLAFAVRASMASPFRHGCGERPLSRKALLSGARARGEEGLLARSLPVPSLQSRRPRSNDEPRSRHRGPHGKVGFIKLLYQT